MQRREQSTHNLLRPGKGFFHHSNKWMAAECGLQLGFPVSTKETVKLTG
jgi:hypothetical protein